MILLVHGEGIKLEGTFLDDVFGMLANDIDHATTSGVCKGDWQS